MKDRDQSEKIRSVAEARRARSLDNVIYIRDYLRRHPESERKLGRRATRGALPFRNQQQDARVYELFPAIILGDEPDDPA